VITYERGAETRHRQMLVVAGDPASAGAAATAPADDDGSAPPIEETKTVDTKALARVLAPDKIAATITGFKVSPEVEAGKVVGVRMSASGPNSLMELLDLQNGDVITEADGVALDSTAAAIVFLQGLGKGKLPVLSIRRGTLELRRSYVPAKVK
jgi:type II secretory pathway component PulC